MGILFGIREASAGGAEGYLHFLARLFGTCAVFYIFFLCRMLGAGDIKLMAVCVGILGVRRGGVLIFLGLVLALLVTGWKGMVWKYGWFGIRGKKLRLAPYLLGGFFLFFTLEKSRIFEMGMF